MIGIIPGSSKTFIIEGMFNHETLEEGKLYVDPETKRIFMYSTIETRSNPTTGYYPIWDGTKKHITKFSNKKYLDKDATITDVKTLSSVINKSVVDKILYEYRKSDNGEVLSPTISDGDNMFTQCVKGILNAKQFTLVDLVDRSKPKLDERTISNYYSALNKITFMRLDKWEIWISYIFHMRYALTVYNREGKKLMSYDYPDNIFDTGIVHYDNITNTDDDPFKKIIKILIISENINKNSLRSNEVDDYTINNMLTTIHSNKALSSQLFSRFIRMADLSYIVQIFEDDNMVFEYKES